MLYRRGRPTSIELLLLMVIPKLSLPLSCHSPLGLHHLLRLVGAARGLVALRRVEVLQVGRRVRTARITEVADRVRARSGAAPDATDVYVFPSVDDQIKPSGPPALRAARSIPQLRGRLAGSAEGRNELTSGSRRAKHLAALDKIVDGSINLWKNQISSPSLSKCPCSSNVGPGEGAEFNRVGDPRRKGSSRHPRDWTAWFAREMRRTLKLIDKSGGLIARNRGAGAWDFTNLVSPRAFNQGEIESVRAD